jgi:hypothetical protein
VDWDQRWPWQLQRMVSRSLTLQHERVIYMLGDSPANRQLIHRHIDVWEFPDGRYRDPGGRPGDQTRAL